MGKIVLPNYDYRELPIAYFDQEKYNDFANNPVTKEAEDLYRNGHYWEAHRKYSELSKEGHCFAATRMAIIEHYELKDCGANDIVFETFTLAANMGCPLASAWIVIIWIN